MSSAHSLISVPRCENMPVYYIGQVIFEEEQQLSKAKKITRIALDVIWTGLSIAICYPPAEAALSFGNQGSLAARIIGDISAIGCFIDWGSLTAWGGIELIHKVMRQRHPAEKVLTKHDVKIILQIIHVFVSIILGVGSRSPAVTVALVFTHSWRWAIFSALIEAGLPSFSTHQLLSKLFSRRCCAKKDFKLLQKVQQHTLLQISNGLERGLRLSVEERAKQFRILYLKECQPAVAPRGKQCIQLFRQIMEINEAHSDIDLKDYQWVMYPRMALKVIFALIGIGLLIQNGLLAETAIDTLSQKEALEILAITLAVVPMLWAVFTIPGQSAAHLFDLVTDLFRIPRENTSFSETFYPKTSRLLQLLALVISLLPYGEIVKIAEQYASFDTAYGSIFIVSNVVTLSLIITQSLIDHIDSGLKAVANSPIAASEIRHAMLLKRKLEKLKEVLSEISMPHFVQFIDQIEDKELKEYLINHALKDEELKQLIVEICDENRPLLINSDPRDNLNISNLET